MLFLVRELSAVEPDTPESYLRRGFRFAEPRWASPVLADRVGVSKVETDGLLDHLKTYAKRGMKSSVRSGGTYLGFFAVRPSISREGGLDTLVYQFARHQIPAYRLPDVQEITDDIRDWVLSLSGRSMKEVGDLCSDDVNGDLAVPTGKQAEEMWIFKSSLILAMDALNTSLPMFESLPEKSFLSAEILEIPSSDDDTTSTASMLIFSAAFPAPIRHGHELPGLVLPHEVSGTYEKQDPMPIFTFVPYSLFTKGQMMLLRGSTARKFAKECRLDLMKRHDISPQTLQAYMTSHRAHRTPRMDNAGNLDNYEVRDRKSDQDCEKVSGDAARQSDSQSRLASDMNGSKGNPNINFEEIVHSDSLTAPAYSLTNATGFLQHTKASGKGNQYSQPSDNSLFPPPRRPRTSSDSDVKRTPLLSNSRPSTSSKESSGGHDPALPRVSTEFTRPSFSSHRPSHDLPSANAVLSASFSKATPQPLAITARLRADDWYSRCMDGIERSPAGQELLGVEW